MPPTFVAALLRLFGHQYRGIRQSGRMCYWRKGTAIICNDGWHNLLWHYVNDCGEQLEFRHVIVQEEYMDDVLLAARRTGRGDTVRQLRQAQAIHVVYDLTSQ